MFAAHHEKNIFSCILKVSIYQLINNLKSGKRNYCYGEKSEENTEPGNLYFFSNSIL